MAVICMAHCAAQVWLLFFSDESLLAIYFHPGWLFGALNGLHSRATQRSFCATAAPYSSCNAWKTNLIGRSCHFDVRSGGERFGSGVFHSLSNTSADIDFWIGRRSRVCVDRKQFHYVQKQT